MWSGRICRGGGLAWRKDRSAVRRYSWAGLIWIGIYLSRFVVQFALYEPDQVVWLSASRIAMGWPLFAVGVFATAVFLWHNENRSYTETSHPSPRIKTRPVSRGAILERNPD